MSSFSRYTRNFLLFRLIYKHHSFPWGWGPIRSGKEERRPVPDNDRTVVVSDDSCREAGPRPSPDIAGESRRPHPHRGWLPRERYGPALRIRSASSGWHAPGCTERRGIERPGAPRPSLTDDAPDPVPFHAKAPCASHDPGRAALALDAVVAPDLQDGGRPAAGRNYPHLRGPGLPDPRPAPLQVHPAAKAATRYRSGACRYGCRCKSAPDYVQGSGSVRRLPGTAFFLGVLTAGPLR